MDTRSTSRAFTAEPVFSNGHTIRTVDDNGITRRRIATVHGPFGDAEKAANAEFIAEAFTVAQETGLTPRQLAEQRNELFLALQAVVWSFDRTFDVSAMANRARAAIEKAQKGGAS